MAVKLPKRYAGRFAVELRPSGRSGWIDDKQKGTALEQLPDRERLWKVDMRPRDAVGVPE